jgi:hypothetical protein
VTAGKANLALDIRRAQYLSIQHSIVDVGTEATERPKYEVLHFVTAFIP